MYGSQGFTDTFNSHYGSFFRILSLVGPQEGWLKAPDVGNSFQAPPGSLYVFVTLA